MRGKNVLIFVDSESVEGALVKGYSSTEDISELVGHFWLRAAALNVCIYIDRISTDANIADAPSRPDKCKGLARHGWAVSRVRWPAPRGPGKGAAKRGVEGPGRGRNTRGVKRTRGK